MTTKTISDFFEVYRPKSPDEQKFVDKHVVIKHKDRNGNGDDVFNAKNIKKADRKKERHGYEPGEDEKVYEEVEQVDELSAGLKARYTRSATADRDDVSQRLSSGQDGDHRFIKPGGKKETAFKRIVKNRDAGIQRANEEVDQGDDDHSGTYEYQHRSGRYVKAKITGHPKTGYKIRWADGSTSYKPNNDELKKTIKSGGLIFNEGVMKTVAKKAARAWNWSGNSIDQVRDDTDTLGSDSREWASKRKVNKHSPAHLQQQMIKRDARNAARKPTNEEVEALDEVTFHHYEITHPSIAPKGGEGAIVHIKGKPATMHKHRVETGDVEGHYGPTRHFKVTDTKTGLSSNHSVYQSDYLPREGNSILSVRPKGSTGGHTTTHNKALAAYLSGKRKLSEDLESVEEMRGRSYATVKPGYYHRGPTSNKPLDDDMRKGLDAIDAAFKKAKGHNGTPKKPVAEDVESIDELSKGKLKNYLDKAFDGSRGSAATPEKFRKSIEMGTVAAKKIGQRFPGSKNVKVKVKATNEDVEQIDEIGDTKAGRAGLGSYINKRAADIGARAYEAGKSISWDADEDAYKKELRHRAGIERAVGKLTKPRKFRRYYGEELASSFVDKYMPEQADMPALTNEERLVSVLMDQNISEAISVDVLALHSTLDEQNQRLLIDNIMEGQIDDVVDFAIQNRN